MHRYFDNSETPKDKTYQKIISQFNRFMEHLTSEEDRQLLSKMVSDSYHKHHKSIMAMESDDPSLVTPLIMALLLDQQLMINRLKHHRRNNESPP
jgi:hypothetical protein